MHAPRGVENGARLQRQADRKLHVWMSSKTSGTASAYENESSEQSRSIELPSEHVTRALLTAAAAGSHGQASGVSAGAPEVAARMEELHERNRDK